jgi:large subunit ribosomal protein L30
MSKIRIVLKRSIEGRFKKHRRIVQALGLRKINQEVIKENNPSIRGMIKKVEYLLKVEELE